MAKHTEFCNVMAPSFIDSSCQLLIVGCQVVEGTFSFPKLIQRKTVTGCQLSAFVRRAPEQSLTTDNQQLTIIKLNYIVAVNQEGHAVADVRLAEDELGHAGHAHASTRVQGYFVLLVEAQVPLEVFELHALTDEAGQH